MESQTFTIYDCNYTCTTSICLLLDKKNYNDIKNNYPGIRFRNINGNQCLPLRLSGKSKFTDIDNNKFDSTEIAKCKNASFIISAKHDNELCTTYMYIKEMIVNY